MCHRVRRAEWSDEEKNLSKDFVRDQSLSKLLALRIRGTKCIP